MSKCSRVWGLMDSSAAIDEQDQVDSADAREHIFDEPFMAGYVYETNAQILARRSRCAKPRSMEMPRFFSSFRRSVSTPVRARTRAVLPWSIWPGGAGDDVFHSSLLILLLAAGSCRGASPGCAAAAADLQNRRGRCEGGRAGGATARSCAGSDGSRTSASATRVSRRKSSYFGHDAEPLSLILLLDISGSMQSGSSGSPARRGRRWGICGRETASRSWSLARAWRCTRISAIIWRRARGRSRRRCRIMTWGRERRSIRRWQPRREYMRKNARPEGRRAILILTDNLSISYQFLRSSTCSGRCTGAIRC